MTIRPEDLDKHELIMEPFCNTRYSRSRETRRTPAISLLCFLTVGFSVDGGVLNAMVLVNSVATPTTQEHRNNADSSEDASESLQQRLLNIDRGILVERVKKLGDASRGSLLYHDPQLTCVRCHEPDRENMQRLGPAIADINNEATLPFLIESLLSPSKQLTPGFQTESILTIDGIQHTGIVMETDDPNQLVLVDPSRDDKPIRIPLDDIEERKINDVSAMPDGLVGAMEDEQSFYDLVSYLVAIKRGGKRAALQLRPPESFFAVAPLPEYESDIDHRRLISSLQQPNLERGEAIYQRFCARCHGTQDQPGSMPTALQFGQGQFKNGGDPFSMYQTLTHGYGLMVAQRWMVPQQKYDVIHYIRETYLKEGDPSQWAELSDSYLATLPKGKQLGPAPVDSKPWSEMDYGNFLMNTYEVGDDGQNIAYKGIAIRLDKGPGGVSQGKHWILYEHDTMRIAAAWSGTGFIDYNGIHFNDRHNVHPRIVGDVHFSNQHQPGWANPQTDSFNADPRVVGRDGKLYGPLPEAWLKYRGLYQSGDRVVLNYTVGDTAILESPSIQVSDDESPVFVRHMSLGRRAKPLLLKIASVENLVRDQDDSDLPGGVYFHRQENAAMEQSSFDGKSYLEASKPFDWSQEISIVARIKTDQDGTIISQTRQGQEWVAGGTSLFVRGGRLVFDIGWVGAVTGKKRIDDNRWHDVALVWQPGKERATLYVDGQQDVRGELNLGEDYDDPVLRIGFTAEDFPKQSAFAGQISNISVFDKAIDVAAFDHKRQTAGNDDASRIAHWRFPESDESTSNEAARTIDHSGQQNHALWIRTANATGTNSPGFGAIVKGIRDPQWTVIDQSLCLRVPAGDEAINISVSVITAESRQSLPTLARDWDVVDLKGWIRGGPDRYPQTLTSKIESMPQSESDPFVVDYLTHPKDNPWACRMRLTGIDFMDDDTALVCAWDGSVWKLTGFLNGSRLQWRRIAHGLFQPLGIRIVGRQVFVTCRDQLVLLEDLNNDGSIDWYRAFNSDHQVTEHFHEFAMGMQTDEAGKFYYAKSARHALPALVPHHGTLLKVAADGSHTDIIGN